MLGPGRTKHTRRDRCVGHQRSALGHRVANLAHLFDVFIVEFAEVVPNAGQPRDDVRLVTTVRYHIMRALLGTEMFPAKVPANVHQLDGVKCATSLPWRSSSVGTLSFESIFNRH